jgi:undecaprenyl-diphosphatase
MQLWHVIVLALVQALTEFLPVSSSGHLALVGFFFGWPYQGLTFDLALHFGTLSAVVIYYWRDLLRIAIAVGNRAQDADTLMHRRLGWGLALGTVPALIVGGLMSRNDAFVESLRIPWLMAGNLIVFGLLLWWADRRSRRNREVASVDLRAAVWIGCAQALALIPGVSRSGITISAGLALGLTRVDAARYTFLLSVPITAAAAAHGAWQLLKSSEHLEVSQFVIGAAFAAVAGVACIHFLLGFLRRVGIWPFVVYRIALGTLVLAVLAWR